MIVGPVASARMVTTPVTSYSNPGGQGARTSLITASGSWTPAAGSFDRTVDGSLVGNSSGAVQSPTSGSASGENIVWDFLPLGAPQFINEVTAQQNGNISGITSRYDYSLNGSVWVAASANFTFTGGPIVTSIAMPPEGARYLRYLAISGTWGGAGYYTEFTFKIAPGAT